MDIKEIRKITRRNTRSKTQFINFNKEEINKLRLEETQNISKEPVHTDTGADKETGKRTDKETDKETGKRTDKETVKSPNKYKIYDISNVEKNNLSHEKIFGSKVVFNNTPVQKYEPLTEKEERTYSFSELLDWVHKKEKRELFPKNKFDYVYKKNKSENTKLREIENEERNIVHMRIEEDIIPCLKSNPFIQADKYFKK